MGSYGNLIVGFNILLTLVILWLLFLIVMIFVDFNGWRLSGIVLGLLLIGVFWVGRQWAIDKYLEYEAPVEISKFMMVI